MLLNKIRNPIILISTLGMRTLYSPLADFFHADTVAARGPPPPTPGVMRLTRADSPRELTVPQHNSDTNTRARARMRQAGAISAPAIRGALTFYRKYMHVIEELTRHIIVRYGYSLVTTRMLL